MHNAIQNILIDLMGLHINDTAYWRKLRELKERVSILTGDVERISAMPEDIEMRAKLLGMVEDFMEHP
ncbi:MAG: hypothetical protein WC164_04835 [Patescibacteria group bacterium]|jgi:hypothetical protein|nr:hypothetical protein [Bacillota bacterium]